MMRGVPVPCALFEYEGALPLLVLAPLLWALFSVRARARRRQLARITGRRTRWLAAERSEGRRAVRRGAFCLGVLLACVALLGPRLGAAEAQRDWRGVDLVICLDLSRSMWAQDLAPDRLGRAQAEIEALAQHARGDRLALVTFAGEARLAVPLTRDLATLVALSGLADPSDLRRGGTDLGAALERALQALEGSASEHSAIVLLTDGEDLGGRGARVAAACRRQGVVVHCVGVGTRLGSKIALADGDGQNFLTDRSGREVVSALDPASLARIADAAGGRFVDAGRDPAALVGLYDDAIVPMARRAFSASGGARPENRFQWPLLAALLCWLLPLGLTERRR